MRIMFDLAFMTFNFILTRAGMYRSICKAIKISKEYLYRIFFTFTVIILQTAYIVLYYRYLPRFHFTIRNFGFIFFYTIGFGKCHFFFSDRSRNFFFHGDCKKTIIFFFLFHSSFLFEFITKHLTTQ